MEMALYNHQLRNQDLLLTMDKLGSQQRQLGHIQPLDIPLLSSTCYISKNILNVLLRKITNLTTAILLGSEFDT